MKRNVRNRRNVLSEIKKLATPEELELYSYVADEAERVSLELCKAIKNGNKNGEGGLVFVYGPVFSGKTLVACLLIDLLNELRVRVVPIQPEVDRDDVPKNRYFSRSGIEKKVISVKSKRDLAELFDKNDVVIVDEVQFFPAEIQSYLLKLILDYVKRGGWVVAMGVLYTSQASEFMLPAVLKDHADIDFSLTATCLKCGSRGARLNQRTVEGMPTSVEDPELLEPSNKVYYEPRCSDCHVIIG